MTCPYCGASAVFLSGSLVYPHRPDLAGKRFWACPPCDAYVGCHAGTDRPLGRIANAELRRAKMDAHAAFDPFWQARQMRRGEAYRWLAEQLGLTADECHIGMFDAPQCQRVVEAVRRAVAASATPEQHLSTAASDSAEIVSLELGPRGTEARGIELHEREQRPV